MLLFSRLLKIAVAVNVLSVVMFGQSTHAKMSVLIEARTGSAKYFHSLIVPVDAASGMACDAALGPAHQDAVGGIGSTAKEQEEACRNEISRKWDECRAHARRIPDCQVTVINGKEKLVCDPVGRAQ